MDARDFTRRRTLTLPVMVATLAQGLVKGLQAELDDFFGKLCGEAGFLRKVSKSAFSQARKKLKPQVFSALNQMLLEAWDAQACAPRWRGWRLLAADTTTLRLPALPEVIERFGCHGDHWGGEAPLAQAIGLFDVSSRLMRHARLAPARSRDGELLAACLDQVGEQDLLLLDRGFPALWLFAGLLQQRKAFCMRIDGLMTLPMEAFMRSGERETEIALHIPPKALQKARTQGYPIAAADFRLRLIRVTLPNGHAEFLATSLMDAQRYPAHEFAALYHQRWRIEECFKLLKCRLAVEHFSGELPDSIEQDFLAKVWLGNLATSMAALADTARNTVHACIPNLTYALSALRSVLPQLLLKPRKRKSLIHRTLGLIHQTLEIQRPERSFPRTRQKVKPVKFRAYKALR